MICIYCGDDKPTVLAPMQECEECQIEAKDNQEATDRLEAELTALLSPLLHGWLKAKMIEGENPEILECAVMAFSERLLNDSREQLEQAITALAVSRKRESMEFFIDSPGMRDEDLPNFLQSAIAIGASMGITATENGKTSVLFNETLECAVVFAKAVRLEFDSHFIILCLVVDDPNEQELKEIETHKAAHQYRLLQAEELLEQFKANRQ